MVARERIGVLGGTFDPLHNGHLRIAEYTMAELALAEVIFIPAGQPYLKADIAVTPAGHRWKMLELALAGREGFRISRLELERSGPTYTLDTLRQLRELLPRAQQMDFIIGWDTIGSLPRWHEPEKLIKLCRLVVVPRPGYAPPDLEKLETEIPGIRRHLLMLNGPEIDVSASDVRMRASRGEDISSLVPPPVAAYIREKALYRDL